MGITVAVSGEDAKASSGVFKAYPEGEYVGEIIDVKQSAVKGGANKGKPTLEVQFKFTEAGPGDEFVGKKYKEFQVPLFGKWASGKSAFQFYQFFKALGVVFPEGDGEVELPDIEDLWGQEVGIRLTREEKEDGKGNKVTDDDGNQVYVNRTSGFFPASKGIKASAPADAEGGFTLSAK